MYHQPQLCEGACGLLRDLTCTCTDTLWMRVSHPSHVVIKAGFVPAWGVMCAGHSVAAAKMDCALTPTDAHVISGSEDGAFPDAGSRCLRHPHLCIPSIPSIMHGEHPGCTVSSTTWLALRC